NRTRLHLRRAYKERQTLLPPRSWSSALLATQRRACDAAGGEIGYQRMTFVALDGARGSMNTNWEFKNMQVLETPTQAEETSPTQINFSPLSHRYTLEELWALPEREDRARYELIGGYLFMVPPPKPPHGDIDAHLARALILFIAENKIEGKVHHPPEAIWLRAEGSTY